MDSNILSTIPLFSSLKNDLLEEIASSLAIRNYPRDQIIFHQGDPGSTLYIITSGQVKITMISPHGEEVLLAILTENECFGELAIFDGEERSATATAMTPTETVCLQQDPFLDILFKHPEMVRDILAVLCKRLRQADAFVQDTIFMNVRSRLAKRLIQLSHQHGIETEHGIVIGLNITQQDIADNIGASRVAVNKELGILQDTDIIHINRKQITILLRQLPHILPISCIQNRQTTTNFLIQ